MIVTIFLWSPTILPWAQLPISPYLVSLNPEDVWQVPLLCLECVLFDLCSLDVFPSKTLSAFPFDVTSKGTSEDKEFSHWSEVMRVLFSSNVSFISQFEFAESSFSPSLHPFLFNVDDGAPGDWFTGMLRGPILLSGNSVSSFPYNYSYAISYVTVKYFGFLLIHMFFYVISLL